MELSPCGAELFWKSVESGSLKAKGTACEPRAAAAETALHRVQFKDPETVTRVYSIETPSKRTGNGGARFLFVGAGV